MKRGGCWEEESLEEARHGIPDLWQAGESAGGRGEVRAGRDSTAGGDRPGAS